MRVLPIWVMASAAASALAADAVPAYPAASAGSSINQEKSMESAKRRVPKVPPVVVGAIRYEAMRGARGRGFAQNGGIVEAVDTKTGKSLWTAVIYTTVYDPHEEADVQDRYITEMKLSPDGKHLQIASENKKSYLLDLSDRTVAIQK